MPKIIVFDLDDTLFHVVPKKTRHILSKSTESAFLSKDAPGVIHHPRLMSEEVEGSELGPVRELLSAIDREGMKTFFDKVYQLICDAKDQGIEPPIRVKIITASPYEEKYVKFLLDKIYEVEYFSNGNFPLEFFNKDALKTVLGKAKAALMKQEFDKWNQNANGSLTLQDIVLIDNESHNIDPAIALGFSTILYPTTINRPEGLSFSQEHPKIANQLNSILVSATQELAQLQSQSFKMK